MSEVVLPSGYGSLENFAKWVEIKGNIVYLINKNGCSSILNSAEIANGYKKPKDRTPPWKFARKISVAKEYVPYPQQDKPRICFYRDPVERFLSFVNWFRNNKYKTPSLDWKLENCEYVNQAIEYARLNNSLENIGDADPHVVSQTNYINYMGSQEKLTIYSLKDIEKVFFELGVPFYRWNESKIKTVFSEDLSEDQLNQIKSIYEEDYRLVEKIHELPS